MAPFFNHNKLCYGNKSYINTQFYGYTKNLACNLEGISDTKVDGDRRINVFAFRHLDFRTDRQVFRHIHVSTQTGIDSSSFTAVIKHFTVDHHIVACLQVLINRQQCIWLDFSAVVQYEAVACVHTQSPRCIARTFVLYYPAISQGARYE